MKTDQWFPRCYDLSQAGQTDDLIDDYLRTAAQIIVKKHYKLFKWAAEKLPKREAGLSAESFSSFVQKQVDQAAGNMKPTVVVFIDEETPGATEQDVAPMVRALMLPVRDLPSPYLCLMWSTRFPSGLTLKCNRKRETKLLCSSRSSTSV